MVCVVVSVNKKLWSVFTFFYNILKEVISIFFFRKCAIMAVEDACSFLQSGGEVAVSIDYLPWYFFCYLPWVFFCLVELDLSDDIPFLTSSLIIFLS